MRIAAAIASAFSGVAEIIRGRFPNSLTWKPMKIGDKVTVKFLVPMSRDWTRPPGPFLRCYVIRQVSNGWQLYDPIRDWSWGVPLDFGDRVVVA